MCFTGVAKKRDYSIQKLANETAIVGSADPLKDQALEQLQELIVTGELEPGSKLLETQIASRLGGSRATLREAMARLNEVGLLVYHPYRGTYVRGLYVSDLEEIFSFRTGLEKMAYQLCWNKRNLVNLADLEMRNQYLSKCISDNDAYGAIVSELHLHSWCYELSQHKLLFQAWERLRPNLQFYFALHQKAHGRSGPQRKSHDTYINLAKGDSLEHMLNHLDDHMQQGLETTKSFLSRESDLPPNR